MQGKRVAPVLCIHIYLRERKYIWICKEKELLQFFTSTHIFERENIHAYAWRKSCSNSSHLGNCFMQPSHYFERSKDISAHVRCLSKFHNCSTAFWQIYGNMCRNAIRQSFILFESNLRISLFTATLLRLKIFVHMQ